MIQATKMCLTFGQRTIFNDVSFIINGNERIGLVGQNGAGKTTLLKAIAGQQPLDSGTLAISKDFTVAYLPQEVVLLSSKTLLTEALNIFDCLGDRLEKAKKLEEELKNAHTSQESELGATLVALQQRFIEEDGIEQVQETKGVLRGLGFRDSDFTKTVDTLSVGWKMRLVLAKLLLQKADFYLFDEPTNHLDLPAKDWFYDFLNRAKFGYMLVSHNRYFLDHVCTTTYEISLGLLKIYKGNYTFFEQQKELAQEVLEKKYLEQQKFIQKQTAIIERFRASASKASTVQSMIKALDKLEPVQFEPTPKVVRFHFPPAKPSGKEVVKADHLAFSFENQSIFSNVSFNIMRGQKAALIAPNGTGKTTLLSILAGKLIPQKGSITFGHNVMPSFFEQDQNRSLDPEKTVLETAENACETSQARQNIRTYLGAFLFSKDDVQKKVKVLSGGEKNRVAMVKVLLQNRNFLVLDEPTNHLDLYSKEILLKALLQFEGTILFVSHDRDFLNRLATNVIELTPNGAITYPGRYDEYIAFKKRGSATPAAPENSNNTVQEKPEALSSADLYMVRKKIRNLESKIEKLEKEKNGQLEHFTDLDYGSLEYNRASEKLKEIESALANALAQWESEIQKEGALQP
ncbi:TPA: hypothetical protein DDZ86_04760 [Candidatus Dependentiae bacterium]|nr:MAG: hypothetical protein A2Y17_09565 [Clostridiales bacterium GWF2_38_85]HBL98923.1 hypothetical protein [Candidatus Dependentiae bacterium]